MPDDVSIALQLVLLIAQLKRPGMMNEIRNAVFVATVGDDPDVPLIQHYVPTAPFRNVARVGREALRMGIEKDLEIGRAAEIDGRIRNLDRIGLWTLRNVGRNKRLKVVARLPARDGNHIGADAVLVIGVARRVIDALVVRTGLDVGEGGGEDIIVVGDAIGVEIKAERGYGITSGRALPISPALSKNRPVLIGKTARRRDAKATRRDEGNTDDGERAPEHRETDDGNAIRFLPNAHFSPSFSAWAPAPSAWPLPLAAGI